ncbi:MAG TPA: transcriptional repressor [Opitutaceae bacterium]|nr:transcriptional repressor [Opitutaceae bacterium]
MPHATTNADALTQRLAGSGLRATPQREIVYQVLLERRDHPTADELFARVKAKMPTISLATVYNCLETLVQCDLIKQVNFEREPTRYCSNLTEHAHFIDTATGQIIDIEMSPTYVARLKEALPPGFTMEDVEINFRGTAAPEALHKSATTTPSGPVPA